MHWKLKALMQNAIATLPSNISYAAYYWVQRNFSGLRQFNPTTGLAAGVDTWRRIRAQGRNPIAHTFLEVGTGRVPLVPLSYWLMGAERTYTFDLNPYVKDELIQESLKYIVNNPTEIEALYGELLNKQRFSQLAEYCSKEKYQRQILFDLCGIEYRAPADAGDTRLPDESIDFHTSRAVLEHIPPSELRRILTEGLRVLKDTGLFVHLVDYSDHFSHSDANISSINFLQYSDRAWRWYAGNRYMYMNRLRHDDFLELFASASARILETEPHIDARAKELLESNQLIVDRRFREKSVEILSIDSSWIIAARK